MDNIDPQPRNIITSSCYVAKQKDTNRLCFDVMHKQRHLYTMQLMETYDAEFDLKSGRFANFSREHQEYVVNLRFDCNGPELRYRFGALVDWIADQYGLWTFTPKPGSVGRMSVDFEFENSTTAVVFKLVWF